MIAFDREKSLEACHRCVAADALKITEDLERYERVIAATRPDVIIETGTCEGYSAKWFAERVSFVVTIDVEPDPTKRIYPGMGVVHEKKPALDRNIRNIDWVIGDSTAVETIAKTLAILYQFDAPPRVMVVLDSDHSAAHVEREIWLYGQLVTSGCFLVVEDGILRWLPSDYAGSPLDAIEKVLVTDPNWRRATEIEEMSPVSLFPRGWWEKL